MQCVFKDIIDYKTCTVMLIQKGNFVDSNISQQANVNLIALSVNLQQTNVLKRTDKKAY